MSRIKARSSASAKAWRTRKRMAAARASEARGCDGGAGGTLPTGQSAERTSEAPTRPYVDLNAEAEKLGYRFVGDGVTDCAEAFTAVVSRLPSWSQPCSCPVCYKDGVTALVEALLPDAATQRKGD